jgi:hypothetical protein
MLNFDWISHLPETWAKWIVILFFLLPLIFAFTMKRAYIFQGAADQKNWRNLKIWAFLLVVVQAAIYVYF